jgi:hypothetical protein
MQLLDDVIEYAVDNKQPVAVLLRKCLVLAYQLKNESLKSWVEKELDGYNEDEEVPAYRRINAPAKETFLGGWGAALYEQPLPPAVLEEAHRHFALTATLTQPIAAYDVNAYRDTGKDKGRYIIEWPADLTLIYQRKFLQGYALNRAWQEIPPSVIVSLVETVRNRVLRFALELQDALGCVSDNIAALPQGKVDQYVQNYIFGGTNVISGTAHDFTQIGSLVIAKHDRAGLTAALKHLGVQEVDIRELESALQRDAAETTTPTLGQRTSAWLKNIGPKLGHGGIKVGTEITTSVITKLVSQFLGIPG